MKNRDVKARDTNKGLKSKKSKNILVPNKLFFESTKMKKIWVPKRISSKPETKPCREVKRKKH